MFVYLDDILVASTSPKEHLKDLKVVFKILNNGLVINRDKCILGIPSLDFLGSRVDEEGTSPLEERVATIPQESAPMTVKELQRFLGPSTGGSSSTLPINSCPSSTSSLVTPKAASP